MADYISRGALIERLEKNLNACNPGTFSELCYRDAIETVKGFTTADVAPVVHGRWYMLDDCANAGLYCSACGRRVHHEEFAYKKLKSKYCPHCGAKMDGGINDKDVG